MARVPGREAIYDAAQLWKDECLVDDGSVLGGGGVWTQPNADQLDEHFVRQPAAPGNTFEEKLERQLAAAGTGAQRLMAEMLWVMMLAPVPAAVTLATKQRLVRRVWAWSGAELPAADPMLDAPLRDGLANTGAGFGSNRASELTFFVALVRSLKAQPTDRRRALLSGPWRSSEWVSGVQGASRPQMRHVLLHLLFPDHFDAIVAGRDRRMILTAFAGYGAGGEAARSPSRDELTGEDQRLLDVRRGLEREHPGEFVHYYRNPWVERWRPVTKNGADAGGEEPPPAPHPAAVRETAAPPRVWAIGAGEGGTQWPEFRERGVIAIGWGALGDLSTYPSRDAILRQMRDLFASPQEPVMGSLACWQFSREMAVGDEVFVKQGRDTVLARGVVTGGYTYDPSRPEYSHVRAVRWEVIGPWTVSAEARVATKTLTEITPYAGMLAHWRAATAGGQGHPPADPAYTVEDALAEGVFLDRDEFERILAALRRRKNVILQGAPGVGKSFVARRLAYALIGAERRDTVQTVQFHQSYAYEDFVQGWRPCEAGGFALRNGVFYEFCRRAQARPVDEPHVFVIDEINRGNLSRILGELMLLIESDKRGPEHAIRLTYTTSGDDTFHVPKNVFVIGLMNTADRSLAMVDYALRRRFAFVTLEPRFASPAFADALRAQGVDDATIQAIRERLARVNAEILGDTKNLGRGFEIGHSYFVPTEPVGDPAAWYERVVAEELRPLLEEYWFDDADRVDRCVDMLLG